MLLLRASARPQRLAPRSSQNHLKRSLQRSPGSLTCFSAKESKRVSPHPNSFIFSIAGGKWHLRVTGEGAPCHLWEEGWSGRDHFGASPVPSAPGGYSACLAARSDPKALLGLQLPGSPLTRERAHRHSAPLGLRWPTGGGPSFKYTRASREVAALGQPGGKWGKEGVGRDGWLHLGFS